MLYEVITIFEPLQPLDDERRHLVMAHRITSYNVCYTKLLRKPFPISTANPPEHRAELPAEADVVVIGGGVIGVSAALFLARAGRRVVLCEKGRIAGEQSSRNWGWVRVQGRDPAEIPVAQEAQRRNNFV